MHGGKLYPHGTIIQGAGPTATFAPPAPAPAPAGSPNWTFGSGGQTPPAGPTARPTPATPRPTNIIPRTPTNIIPRTPTNIIPRTVNPVPTPTPRPTAGGPRIIDVPARNLPRPTPPAANPSTWSRLFGTAAAPRGLGWAKAGVTKLAPLQAGLQVLSAGEQIISPEARKEAVDKYSTDLGTAGNVGRALKGGFLDPARAGSAFIQGVTQLPDLWAKHGEYASSEQAEADKAASEEAKKGRRKKVLSAEKGLRGVPDEFVPSKFQQTKYALSPSGDLDDEKRPIQIAGAQKMGATQFFYGPPEVDKEKAMAQEREMAEVQGRKPRSWEEVEAARSNVTDKELYWTDEERAAYVELAKNDPDKLRSWFDADRSGDISPRERKKMMLGGFRGNLQREDEAKEAARLKQEQIAKQREDTLEAKRAGRIMSEGAKGLSDWAGKFERDYVERPLQRAQIQVAKNKLKKDRIAFAKGLEGDLAYSLKPDSAFQNPEIRKRIMDQAVARAAELDISEPQLREFIRNKELDGGFSESYADFHKRTTAGGGLRTGSVGGKRTVSAPKRKGGGIKSDAEVRREEADRQYQAWLYNKILQEQHQQQLEGFSQTQPRSFFNPEQ